MDTNVTCVLVEHGGGKVHGTSRMLLHHAAALGAGPVHVLLAAAAAQDEVPVLDALRRMGAAAVTALETEPCDTGLPVDAVAQWLRDMRPLVTLMPATPAGSLLAARLAAGHGFPLVADCIALGLDGGRIATRISTAGGMAVVEVEPAGTMPIAVMPQREFEGPEPQAQDAPVRVARLACGPVPPIEGLETVSAAPIAPDDMTLAEASVIVSGGRGLGKPEVFDLLRELASLIGGHVGASRVATDLGWIDREHLVGMSGATVRPALYLAIGISGAPHHLMGMREAATIVALNTDPSAPIFQLATHAFVGDMHAVVPRVIERLKGQAPWTS